MGLRLVCSGQGQQRGQPIRRRWTGSLGLTTELHRRMAPSPASWGCLCAAPPGPASPKAQPQLAGAPSVTLMDGLSQGTSSWGQCPAACGTHASSITRGSWQAGRGSCSAQHVPSEAAKWASPPQPGVGVWPAHTCLPQPPEPWPGTTWHCLPWQRGFWQLGYRRGVCSMGLCSGQSQGLGAACSRTW